MKNTIKKERKVVKTYFDKRYLKEMILCECGCGTLISKYGKNGMIRHLVKGHYTLEMREKARIKYLGKNNPFYGKHHTEKNRNLLSKYGSRTLIEKVGEERAKEINRINGEKHKIRQQGKNNSFYGKKHSEETIEYLRAINSKTFVERFGKERAEEIGKKISNLKKKIPNYSKGKTYEELYGKKKSDELKKLRSENFKKYTANRIIDEKTRMKMSKKQKELWSNKEYAKKSLKRMVAGRHKRPTSYEKKITSLCIENNLPFVYVGNGNFFIGTKNPDFINENEKMIIEVFYSYYKIIAFGSVENYKTQREEYFKKYGYKVLFLDENDLNNKEWKLICLNKIESLQNVAC